MTIKSKITSLAVATTLAATSFAPLATSASADGWRDRGHTGYAQHVNHRRRHFNRHRQFNRHGWRHGHRNYAYKKKNRTGKYIALGFGALMLGIIASQASRNHHDYNYNNHDY